jgi:hypothetical protein
MACREPYKGYVLRADPVRRGARWVAGVPPAPSLCLPASRRPDGLGRSLAIEVLCPFLSQNTPPGRLTWLGLGTTVRGATRPERALVFLSYGRSSTNHPGATSRDGEGRSRGCRESTLRGFSGRLHVTKYPSWTGRRPRDAGTARPTGYSEPKGVGSRLRCPSSWLFTR